MNLTARCCSLRALILSAFCAVLTGLTTIEAIAADASLKMPDAMPLQSGPETGATIHSFFVRAVTGPHRNRSVCYVCRYGTRPVVAVFMPETARIVMTTSNSSPIISAAPCWRCIAPNL